jgi:hypothetical protein
LFVFTHFLFQLIKISKGYEKGRHYQANEPIGSVTKVNR